MYEELKPDLVTMDIIMPGIDGIEAAVEILKKDPAARIVMLSYKKQLERKYAKTLLLHYSFSK